MEVKMMIILNTADCLKLGVKEFAAIINVNEDNVLDWMSRTRNLSYATNRVYHLQNFVNKLELTDEQKTNVFNYLNMNMFNANAPVMFHNDRGWGPEVRSC